MTTLREAAAMAKKATAHDQLIDELLNSNIPKTEREHDVPLVLRCLHDLLKAEYTLCVL